ncbi:WXG100 family type VII secretion target [Micromonospora rifamycinica]|uniref:WXG100 family type VII secretion target n=1 Tax=Micromonospora rifamycinica TaxID=291594 RepID=A0A125Q1J3_9ACTN|nr:WXG100 family type VII secretion target [Micromonospora rifamycinica]KWV32372.1 hypothetical protein AWV63_12765 [Micromonospora rifamycinica]SCG46564.1 WXG100 family type VII secretion target [Micromonospora rifamycinica]
MPLGNEVDEQTIRNTISAMNQTDAQCDAAQRAVDNTSSFLDTQWRGEAKTTFTTSIQQWLEGLSKVKQGLLDLNTAMTSHYQTSAQVEQDNALSASWT